MTYKMLYKNIRISLEMFLNNNAVSVNLWTK